MRWGCLSLADVVLVMCCVGVCGASARWLQEEDSARASSLHWTLQLLLSSAAAKAAAVSFSCAVLLLGKALSTRGPLAEVAERWRSVHMARLEANSCTCVSIQQLRNRVLDELLQTAGFFAEEDFYMLVAPLMFWVVPSLAPFCFNLIGITLLGLLVGDSLKDILHVPRPSHPKLWTHSHSQGTSEEYGMPSTHAMNAVSNSLLFFMYTASDNEHVGSDVEDEGTVTVSTITSKGACQLAALWCTIICVSRLYLGVHTVRETVAAAPPPNYYNFASDFLERGVGGEWAPPLCGPG
jgi:membrane-associated phospholipid phosphatase